jgi:hypothetical protein
MGKLNENRKNWLVPEAQSGDKEGRLAKFVQNVKM